MAQHATNTRSKRRRVYAHQTPDGKECPHYAHQENLERTNKALAACNLPLEDIPNAPIRFD